MSSMQASLGALLLEELHAWGIDGGACALIECDGTGTRTTSAGAVDTDYPWASVTKIVAALAVLDVVHEGRLSLDDPAGPVGSTVRHLLGHASGLSFDDDSVLAKPGTRRIYSNTGIEVAVQIACERSGTPDAAALLTERVLTPLGMRATTLQGSPAHGLNGPLRDLALLAEELLVPRVLRAGVVDDATTLSFPGLAGILPGFGRQDPNDWGLGVELKGAKTPHWMAPQASPSAFGHFGQSGSFIWVDRPRGLAACALTGVPFGPWASEGWPRSSARWISALEGQRCSEGSA